MSFFLDKKILPCYISGEPAGQNTTSNSSNLIKQWLRSGDIEKLEKAVIDGHGLKLIRETTADPRARHFLKTVPVYMVRLTTSYKHLSKIRLKCTFNIFKKQILTCTSVQRYHFIGQNIIDS